MPGTKCYKEDILLLVIPTTTYSKKVPVMVRSKIIDRALGMITKGELVRATTTWKQAYFSVVMSRSLQLSHRSARGWGCYEGATSPLLLTLLCLRNSLWMMSMGMSAPQRGSPFPCFAPSTYTAIQTSEGIACGSMCLLGQHGAPSC